MKEASKAFDWGRAPRMVWLEVMYAGGVKVWDFLLKPVNNRHRNGHCGGLYSTLP